MDVILAESFQPFIRFVVPDPDTFAPLFGVTQVFVGVFRNFRFIPVDDPGRQILPDPDGRFLMRRLDYSLNKEVFQLDPDLPVQLFLPQSYQVTGPGLFGSDLFVGIQNDPVAHVGFRIQLLKHQLKRLLHVFQRRMDRTMQLVQGVLGSETPAIRIEECQRIQ